MSRSPWTKICSSPALSSKRSSLKPLPPLLELLFSVDLVFSSGSVYGGMASPLYSTPVTTGRSGSPSRKSTITSWPTRGRNIVPQFFPAHCCATRTQHELFSSPSAYRSQWKRTLMRPYSSVQISSPDGPTTIAVCGPLVRGFSVLRVDRQGVFASIASIVQVHCALGSSPDVS